MKKKVTNLVPIRVQVVSLEKYLEIYEKKRGEIQSAKIIPPQLGRNDFGRIVVEWKNPVFSMPPLVEAN
jgi:hypothetical protein